MDKNYIATIWLTGLSASGKTTLAECLKTDLNKTGINNVELLDGEDVRNRLKNFNYDIKARESMGLCKAEMALKYNKNGKIVIVTGITHKKDIRYKIRGMITDYFEVYLKCPVNVCAHRDYKGNYERALKGEYANFIGVTEPYQESNTSDLILGTSMMSIDESAKTLFEKVFTFLNRKK